MTVPNFVLVILTVDSGWNEKNQKMWEEVEVVRVLVLMDCIEVCNASAVLKTFLGGF